MIHSTFIFVGVDVRNEPYLPYVRQRPLATIRGARSPNMYAYTTGRTSTERAKNRVYQIRRAAATLITASRGSARGRRTPADGAGERSGRDPGASSRSEEEEVEVAGGDTRRREEIGNATSAAGEIRRYRQRNIESSCLQQPYGVSPNATSPQLPKWVRRKATRTRSIVPLYCSALSLARSAQAERDNESCFFVCAAGVHRFISVTKMGCSGYRIVQDTKLCRCEVSHESVAMASNGHAGMRKEGLGSVMSAHYVIRKQFRAAEFCALYRAIFKI
ncbi:hypothetical protein EVAR_66688_1 [Eumeta japonica]|uniref:Uncharacterized protein n=1 Tax=Eumeta variegata TaxID=151549 RepID=A0A4C1ZIK6_EUMVA|nr:hypothetical protein EVAR_66688_1 [Eumeta japonica]